MLRPVGDTLGNWLDPLKDLGRFAGDVLDRVGTASDTAERLSEGAVGLVEGYASRSGILTPPVFALLDVLASRGSDRDFDGLFVGAAGSYPNGPRYVHYVNRRDPVAALFGLGPFANPLARPGRGAVVHRFSEGDNAHGFEQTYLPRRVPFEQARRRDCD